MAAFRDGRVLDVERGAPPSDEMPRRNWGPRLRLKMLDRAADTIPPVHLQAWAESVCIAPSVRAMGAPVLVELRHRFRGGGGAEDGHRGVAGDDLEQEEGNQGHTDEHGHDGQEALGDVRCCDRRPSVCGREPPRRDRP